MPMGYICQLERTERKSGRRKRTMRPASKAWRSPGMKARTPAAVARALGYWGATNRARVPQPATLRPSTAAASAAARRHSAGVRARWILTIEITKRSLVALAYVLQQRNGRDRTGVAPGLYRAGRDAGSAGGTHRDG